MDEAPNPPIEDSLLQRWFPPGKITFEPDESLSETDLREIAHVLRQLGHTSWSRIPRIYTVLRLLRRLDLIDTFVEQAISDICFPFTNQTLPLSLDPAIAQEFLQLQRVVLSSDPTPHRQTDRQRRLSNAKDVPLGQGASAYVGRVIDDKIAGILPVNRGARGNTFQRDPTVQREIKLELDSLRRLRDHRHLMQLIGNFKDPRVVSIMLSPVPECDLREFLESCSLSGGENHSPRTFFGCLASALSYLHNNNIYHNDMKPQNVLVLHQTVYITNFLSTSGWSDTEHNTNPDALQKSTQYCAPEVDAYSPGDTPSDLWSLGCIFLEIWTVLKGQKVASLHAFLEATKALSSCYHLNIDSAFDWMSTLELNPWEADNPPLRWIRNLLVHDKDQRRTARHLLSEIESFNSGPNLKFVFSGECCIADLESKERMITSTNSVQDSDQLGGNYSTTWEPWLRKDQSRDEHQLDETWSISVNVGLPDPPVAPRGILGLNNLGNTGWMNTVLQCVRSIEEITAYFLHGAYKQDLNTTNSLGFGGAIAEAYYKLLVIMCATGDNNSLPELQNFKKKLGHFYPNFSGYGQQDTQEFLSLLIDALQEDLNKIKKKPYTANPESDEDTIKNPEAIKELCEKIRAIYKTRNDSAVADLFTGFCKIVITCPVCNSSDINFSPYSMLTLQLPIGSEKVRTKGNRSVPQKNGITLHDCFTETCNAQVLSKDNAWLCNSCDAWQCATKKFDLWTSPDILILHLLRCPPSRTSQIKNNIFVDFPLEGLDLTTMVSFPEGKQPIYDLFAVINHKELGPGSGVYTAVAKNFFGNQWYEYNDLDVQRIIDPETLVTSQAYVLFYRRRSIGPLGPPKLGAIVRTWRSRQ